MKKYFSFFTICVSLFIVSCNGGSNNATSQKPSYSYITHLGKQITICTMSDNSMSNCRQESSNILFSNSSVSYMNSLFITNGNSLYLCVSSESNGSLNCSKSNISDSMKRPSNLAINKNNLYIVNNANLDEESAFISVCAIESNYNLNCNLSESTVFPYDGPAPGGIAFYNNHAYIGMGNGLIYSCDVNNENGALTCNNTPDTSINISIDTIVINNNYGYIFTKNLFFYYRCPILNGVMTCNPIDQQYPDGIDDITGLAFFNNYAYFTDDDSDSEEPNSFIKACQVGTQGYLLCGSNGLPPTYEGNSEPTSISFISF